MADETTTLPSPAPAASPDNPWAGVGPLPQGPFQSLSPWMYGLAAVTGGLGSLLGAERTYQQQQAQQQSATIVNSVADRYVANNDHAGFLAAMQHPSARPFISMLDPTSAAALRQRMDQSANALATGAQTRGLGDIASIMKYQGQGYPTPLAPEFAPGGVSEGEALTRSSAIPNLKPETAMAFARQFGLQPSRDVRGVQLSWNPATGREEVTGVVPETGFQEGRPYSMTPGFARPGDLLQAPQIAYGQAVPSRITAQTIDDNTRTAAMLTNTDLNALIDNYNARDPNAIRTMNTLGMIGKDVGAGQLSGVSAEVASAMGLPLNLALMKVRDPNLPGVFLDKLRGEMEKRAYGQAFSSAQAGAASLAFQPFASKPFEGHEVWDRSTSLPFQPSKIGPNGQPMPVSRLEITGSGDGRIPANPNAVFLTGPESNDLRAVQTALTNIGLLQSTIQQHPEVIGRGLIGETMEKLKMWLGYDSPTAMVQAMRLGDPQSIAALGAGKRITNRELGLLSWSEVNPRDQEDLALRKIGVRQQIFQNIEDRLFQRPVRNAEDAMNAIGPGGSTSPTGAPAPGVPVRGGVVPMDILSGGRFRQ